MAKKTTDLTEHDISRLHRRAFQVWHLAMERYGEAAPGQAMFNTVLTTLAEETTVLTALSTHHDEILALAKERANGTEAETNANDGGERAAESDSQEAQGLQVES